MAPVLCLFFIPCFKKPGMCWKQFSGVSIVCLEIAPGKITFYSFVYVCKMTGILLELLKGEARWDLRFAPLLVSASTRTGLSLQHVTPWCVTPTELMCVNTHVTPVDALHPITDVSPFSLTCYFSPPPLMSWHPFSELSALTDVSPLWTRHPSLMCHSSPRHVTPTNEITPNG